MKWDARIIEFVGINGAGKSSICHALAETLADDGVTVCVHDGIQPRAGLRRRLATLHPMVGVVGDLLSTPLLGLAAARKVRSGQELLAASHLCRYEYMRSKVAGMHGWQLLEEGPLTGVVRHGDLGLASHVSRPDFLAHVDLSPLEAWERIRAREWSVDVERLPADQAVELLAARRQRVFDLVEELPCDQIVLDGRVDPQMSAARICEWLEECVARRPS